MTAIEWKPPYFISGQAGKALGPARISLTDFGVTSLSPEFRSMETDTVGWTQRGGIVPDYLQEVSIWDASGARIFTGIATTVDPGFDGTANPPTEVVVSGPWWWLEQTQLTALLTDDVATTMERPQFVTPAQDLAISIRALLDRLQALGVPLRCGQIDPTFAVPQMVLQGRTGADALRTMLGWLPDAMTRVHYDLGGVPALDVTRRPTAETVTLRLQKASDLTAIPRLKQRRELRPAVVKVQGMQVNSVGEVIYTEQVAGEDNGGPLGRQLLAVSGPGTSDFRSYTPRVATLQTLAVPSDYTSLWAYAEVLDPVIVNAQAQYGQVGWSSFGNTGYQGVPVGVAGIGTHRLIAGQVVDFLKTEFDVVEAQTRVYGWILGQYPSSGWTGATNYLRNAYLCYSGYSGGYYNLAVYVDFTVPTINLSYPSLTVFVHPEDQALVTPVPNLASNLFRAQDWPVWEGEIPILPGGAVPLPGSTVSIRGGRQEWVDMRALVASSRIDLATGRGAVRVGAPPRRAGTSLAQQFSRPASGNVINI